MKHSDKVPEMASKDMNVVESVVHANAFQKPIVPNFSYDAEKQVSEYKP